MPVQRVGAKAGDVKAFRTDARCCTSRVSKAATEFLLNDSDVAGLLVDGARLILVATDFPVHKLWLGAGKWCGAANLGKQPPGMRRYRRAPKVETAWRPNPCAGMG